MVKLAPAFFADAAAQMRTIAGVEQTRLALKVRPRNGTIDAKATDGKTTLTTRIGAQSEFKILERIVSEYVTAATSRAIPSNEAERTSAKGKHKRGKKTAPK